MTLMLMLTGFYTTNSMIKQWQEYYQLKESETRRMEEDLVLLMAAWL